MLLQLLGLLDSLLTKLNSGKIIWAVAKRFHPSIKLRLWDMKIDLNCSFLKTALRRNNYYHYYSYTYKRVIVIDNCLLWGTTRASSEDLASISPIPSQVYLRCVCKFYPLHNEVRSRLVFYGAACKDNVTTCNKAANTIKAAL